MFIRPLLTAGLAACLLAPAAAGAADAPLRKSGLWEIRTETGAGGPMPGPVTMQMCIDQRQDDLLAGMDSDVRRRCSKMDMTRAGDKVTIDSVCEMNGYTITGRTVITGNLTTDYRMENTSRFAPPMNGMQTMSSTMTGKWIGPCKPGQQHGTVTVSGMPGMGPGVEFRIDPELLKQMQQQYAH